MTGVSKEFSDFLSTQYKPGSGSGLGRPILIRILTNSYTMSFRMLLCFLLFSIQAKSQNVIFSLTDERTGEPIRTAYILSNRNRIPVQADRAGLCKFTEPAGKQTFDIRDYSYIPQTREYDVPPPESDKPLQIALRLELKPLLVANVASAQALEAREVLNATAPINVLTREDIATSSCTELAQILQYLMAFINSNRQVIADGTDHIDPVSLRGFGPDQILILVNGKRRHASALVNINNTFGRGSVSTDLNTIPLSLIKRVEILRGDAASLYGSDAIAGVINIVLRDVTDYSSATNGGQRNRILLEGSLQTGGFFTNADVGFQPGTKRLAIQDGLTYMLNLSAATKVGANGFLAVGLMAGYRNPTNRAGFDTRPLLYKAEPIKLNTETEAAYMARFRAEQLSDSIRGLSRRNIRAGIAQMQTIALMLNSELPIGGNRLYLVGGLSQKQGNGAGFYRLPRQTTQTDSLLFPNGFLPQIGSTIRDVSGILGIKGSLPFGGLASTWIYDISNTIGANQFGFTVLNSTNASIVGNQQTTFNAGRLGFLQNTINANIINSVEPRGGPFKRYQWGLGAEYRYENYSITPGEEKSWSRSLPDNPAYTGTKIPGAQVFPGFKPTNALSTTRNSQAAYATGEISFGRHEQTRLEGAVRWENYSDFGTNWSYKAAFLHQLFDRGRSSQSLPFLDRLNLRGSLTTGFRAPSLHQRWFNKESTQNIGGELRQIQTINYSSSIVQTLGLPNLEPEISQNYSAGLVGARGGQRFVFSLDGYWVAVQNRIVFSGQLPASNPTIKAATNNPLINSVQLFTNAVNTQTRGVEAQLSVKSQLGWRQRLDYGAMFALNQTSASLLASTNQLFADSTLRNSLFDRQERARFERFTPRGKWVLNLNYHFLDTKNEQSLVTLRWQAIRFGEVTYLEPGPFDVESGQRTSDQTFGSRWVQNMALLFTIKKVATIQLGADNLFDVYPDKQFIHPRNSPGNLASTGGYTGALDNSSNGNVVYSRTVTQFGANGRFFYVKLRIGGPSISKN